MGGLSFDLLIAKILTRMAVLYRKYRPQKLADVVGQEAITNNLLKQLESGKIAHAYVFSGPRGTGKTSTARIIAKAINCKKAKGDKYTEPCGECEACVAIAEGRYLDLIEIDAASNRGIDEIRELREKIGLAPAEGRFKVYIIDEVHMLTNEAFNALLKTLEEPPAHAIFILATTEPQKVPATILSRAQRFDFGRPPVAIITSRLETVSKKEGWTLKKEALTEIAKAADGAFRDAEVLLEKVGAVNPAADEAEVRQILGRSEGQADLIKLIIEGETEKALSWLAEFLEAGGNIRLLLEGILEDLRALLLVKQGIGKDLLAEITLERFNELQSLASKIANEKAIKWVGLFTQAFVDLRNASIPQLPLELAIIEAIGFEKATDEVEMKTESQPRQETNITQETDEIQPEASPKKPKEEKVKAVSSKVKLADIEKAWDQILTQLKPKNNSLEIFLRGATPKELDEGMLVVEFGYRFHKDRFDEPKNRELLEGILEDLLGEPVRIKGTVGATKPKPKTEAVKEDQLAGRQEADPVEVFGKIE